MSAATVGPAPAPGRPADDPVLALEAPLLELLGAMDGIPWAEPSGAGARRALLPAPSPVEDPWNAVVRWCDVALPAADGPLAGTRVAVKDCMAVAGLPMTAGSPLLQGFVSDRDSAVVERVLAAGGRIVAMTNMDDLAVSPGGDASWYGPTRNPHDPARTAGGSSGGAAAVLHTGRVDLSLGTDTGGSVRIPAAWCGVVGHKPTHGLVAHGGVLGADPLLDHVGTLTRTVEAAAVALQVLAGPHGADPRQPAALPTLDVVGAVAAAAPSLAGARLGVVAESLDPALGTSGAVAAAFATAVGALRAAGAEVVEVSIPEHLQAGPVGFALFTEGLAATLDGAGDGAPPWPALADALRAGVAERLHEASPQVRLALHLGRERARSGHGAHRARAASLRAWLQAAYDRALRPVDALVLPTVPVTAHEVLPDLDVGARVGRSWGLVGNTAPTDLTGHPATSLPLASADGLPVGVMLVGRAYQDHRLLALARSVEQAIGWAAP